MLIFSLPLENIDFFHLSVVSLHTKVFDFFSQESKFVWIDTIIKDIYIFFLLIKRELQYRKPMGGGTSASEKVGERKEKWSVTG